MSGSVEKELIEPGELREHLQVGVVARGEVRVGALGAIAGAAITLPQLAITRIAADHVDRVRLKKILQREAALMRGEVLGRLGHQIEERIVRPAGDVILDLRHQRRHQVEILMDVGKLVQQLHHAVIILERVQPHPGQAILAGDHVFVKRLVHVPEQHKPNLRRTSGGNCVTHGRNLEQPSVSGEIGLWKLEEEATSFEPRAMSL